MSDIAIGSKIQFKAARILKGNPVSGVVISEDDEWLTIELDHYIEGMANGWEEGEQKSFRKSLIGPIKVI